jgi:hypothetical protein
LGTRNVSNGKSMDVEAVTWMILERSPGLKRKYLLAKVRGKTGKSYGTVTDTWASMVSKGELYREKGRYWNKRPGPQKSSFIRELADWSERRAIRKKRERKRGKKESWKKYERMKKENDKQEASIIEEPEERKLCRKLDAYYECMNTEERAEYWKKVEELLISFPPVQPRPFL